MKMKYVMCVVGLLVIFYIIKKVSEKKASDKLVSDSVAFWQKNDWAF